jgi:hypothetical protein
MTKTAKTKASPIHPGHLVGRNMQGFHKVA